MVRGGLDNANLPNLMIMPNIEQAMSAKQLYSLELHDDLRSTFVSSVMHIRPASSIAADHSVCHSKSSLSLCDEAGD